MKSVSSKVDLAAEEKKIAAFWQEKKVFNQSNEQYRNQREFAFYDGPPFANGLPHYGHLLANTIKDVVPRYWNMKGYFIERRFGWDCHGLPVEYEIEKKQGLSGRQDILNLGIDRFNELCRKSVLHYTGEWKKTIDSLGRWVDWDNQYRTMDKEFMESVWWVFKELFKKGLVYSDYKVVPYSPRITAVLSNFEANQNYQDIQDPAITVKFNVLGEKDTYFLAWTTTPWTLVANLALAVGEKLTYVRVVEKSSGDHFYLSKNRFLETLATKENDYEVLDEVLGSQLVGKRYQPMFTYFSDQENSFQVLSDDFVSTDEGTGIVHMAPCYGEDDFRVCRKAGIQLVDVLDEEARFLPNIVEFAGKKVKESDREIIAFLKSIGALFRNETINHSYPHCERTNSPLIYRAIPAWYVAVEKIKDKIMANHQKINWVPEHLKDGRMGKWLENARDWAISRNRFWGTPIPIWICQKDESHREVIGSRQELEELSGQTFNDLHKHHVDKVSLSCRTCGHEMKRIQEVFDCWFESGSMPYAQLHYPFENQERFRSIFPADFIAEGLDQTRGWFYTLSVLSTALFDQPAFKNVVVNGMVLAEDGRKMSKRWANYTPPDDLIQSFGADSIRLYMLNSAILRGEDLKFSNQGVKNTIRAVILPLWNSYSFLTTYGEADHWTPSERCLSLPQVTGEMDKWILSRLHSVAKNVSIQMEHYRLYLVVPAVLDFIEELTNWYIRICRRRFWGGTKSLTQDSREGYETLYYVLANFCKVLAPFAPFFTENIYRGLTDGFKGVPESVHLSTSLAVQEEVIDNDLEQQMQMVKTVVELGRSLRSKHQVKTRQVLAGILVISKESSHRAYLESSRQIIQQELNIKNIEFSADESKYVSLTIKPNLPVLGKRLGRRLKAVQSFLKDVNKDSVAISKILREIDLNRQITVEGIILSESELLFEREPLDDRPVASENGITILLDTNLNDELISEGFARELVNRVQGFRKDLNLNVSDRIELCFMGSETLTRALRKHEAYVCSETLTKVVKIVESSTGFGKLTHKKYDIGEEACTIGIGVYNH